MTLSEPIWCLANFEDQLDAWIARESPPGRIRYVATAWIMSRMEDPYYGARREPGFENLWFAVLSEARYHGTVVVCSYWIDAVNHTRHLRHVRHAQRTGLTSYARRAPG